MSPESYYSGTLVNIDDEESLKEELRYSDKNQDETYENTLIQQSSNLVGDNNSEPHPVAPWLFYILPDVSQSVRMYLAEYFGTTVMIALGNGVCASMTFGTPGDNTLVGIHICWGLAVLFGIMISISVSGAHLNPAVTIAGAIFKGFPWKHVPGYLIAQFLGAFTGAVIVLLDYFELIMQMKKTDPIKVAGIFATFPMDIPLAQVILDQLVGTSILLIGIYAIVDSHNANIPSTMIPFSVGALVMAIGFAFGSQSGYAINPFRDFAPRLVALMAIQNTDIFNYPKSGSTDFKHDSYTYWWIPFIFPFFGALIGAALYSILIERHHFTKNDKKLRIEAK